jgi:hypothetical protein
VTAIINPQVHHSPGTWQPLRAPGQRGIWQRVQDLFRVFEAQVDPHFAVGAEGPEHPLCQGVGAWAPLPIGVGSIIWLGNRLVAIGGRRYGNTWSLRGMFIMIISGLYNDFQSLFAFIIGLGAEPIRFA